VGQFSAQIRKEEPWIAKIHINIGQQIVDQPVRDRILTAVPAMRRGCHGAENVEITRRVLNAH